MKDLSLLHPQVRIKAESLIALAKSKLGLNVIVTWTLRTNEEQLALYSKGRFPLLEVNRRLAVAKMAPITAKENIRVTNASTADDSFHGYGLAFDIAVTDKTGKIIVWTPKSDWNKNGKSDWTDVGELAEGLGLEWGGNWTNRPDPPHYQDRLGYTIAKLKQLGVKSGKTLNIK